MATSSGRCALSAERFNHHKGEQHMTTMPLLFLVLLFVPAIAAAQSVTDPQVRVQRLSARNVAKSSRARITP
jgi:hypothetical protein